MICVCIYIHIYTWYMIYVYIYISCMYVCICVHTFFIHLSTTGLLGWRRQWHPIPVLLLRKSHGWRSLVGYSPWGHYESVATERLHFHFSLSRSGEGNSNPLHCSCLENPRDSRAWWAAVYGSHRVGHDWSDLAAAAAGLLGCFCIVFISSEHPEMWWLDHMVVLYLIIWRPSILFSTEAVPICNLINRT